MPNTAIINDAMVITKPKSIRSILGVAPSDRMTFVAENDAARGVNSVLYAMQQFQKDMQGQGEAAGIKSEDDVADWIMESRRKENIV